MLTADLVEVRRRGDQLYLKPLAEERARGPWRWREAYLGLARAHLGRERGAAARGLPGDPGGRRAIASWPPGC